MLTVYNFIENIIQGTLDMIQDGYDTARTFVPDINLRLAAGFDFFFDTDVILIFSIFPGAITKLIGGMIDQKTLELNSLNVGFRIRKPLLKDNDGFPAISLGIVYRYADFHIGYDVPEYNQNRVLDSIYL